MNAFNTLGFIGLGVMGEPICRNLAQKTKLPVWGLDTDPEPLRRLASHGVQTAADIAAVMKSSDVVFLSLPSGEVVQRLAEQADGLLAHARAGQIIIDLSTSPVDVTRNLAQAFAAKGTIFMDAPVARTRAAAEAGTLSVMVGSEPETFERVRPLIATFASEITLCGPIGSGQVLKIMNNMVLFETVMALSEARAIARRAGVDPKVLLETLTLGSSDSFALRNHGLKAILPGEFPEKAFPVDYARKDLRYALSLADQTGVEALGARSVETWFARAVEAGLSTRYFPVISRLVDSVKSGSSQ
ncbi:NAD(P)-dependent oxidoreductase [Bordetella sp. 2513F-2]